MKPPSTIKLSDKVAISLQYDHENMSAPTVTAKGTGHLAEQIIQIAQENNIPLQQDAQLVDLLSQVELNTQIPEALYEAIAQVLIFAYEVSGKEFPEQNKQK